MLVGSDVVRGMLVGCGMVKGVLVWLHGCWLNVVLPEGYCYDCIGVFEGCSVRIRMTVKCIV